IVYPVDIKADFVSWIARDMAHGKSRIIRLMFPDGIFSMLVTPDLIKGPLPKYCLHKIRQYLRSERNAGYMRSKLAAIFRNRESAMKDMLSSVMTTTEQALRTVFAPTDFSFHFWTQLSSSIIKEYSQKKEKMADEHGYCQAAYLIGYYNVHHRGLQQKNLERDSALRQLENALRKPPYVYTITQVHQFTDSKGVPLTRKYTVEDVNAYISERIRPGKEGALPLMIRVKAIDGNEYFVFRDYVPRVTLEHLFTARREFRNYYIDLWSNALKQHSRPDEMQDDSVFANHVEDRLKEQNPLLFSLLNYNLLYLSREEGNVPADLAADIDDLFDSRRSSLKPIPEILNLDRKKLSADARLLLPFWQGVPFLSGIVAFFRRMFVGPSEHEVRKRETKKRKSLSKRDGRQKPTTVRYSPDHAADHESDEIEEHVVPSASGTSDSATRRAQLARFKDTVRQLQNEYVSPGSTPEKTLASLAERWNPLIDETAKRNLIEDVNSLARDFLRRMKVSFRLIPPTRNRVEEWADRLCQNDAFHQIRRTQDLKEYLKLYMLTRLGK
ncbi:MAG: hypothetical protein ACLFNT_06325, partial [Spirochaetales bacterium]